MAWAGKKNKSTRSLQDFEIEAEIELLNRQAQVGRVEIYLLDVNNEMIGKMAMKDAWANTTQNRGEMRLGPFDNDEYFIVHPDYAGAWNDFKGILRLTRVGNRWRAYIAKVNEDGTHHARHTSPYYVDLEEKYMDRLAQVQVHLGTSGEYEPATKRVSRIKVKKINQPGSQEIPYIAHPGDVIEIDTHTHRINKNGEPQQWLWDPAGDWIPLKPGKTELAVHPQTVRVKASYQSRWY
ncbi:hypothetical protein [Thalassobacillus sp. C254]|uniref:phage distal tail protein n=1 Tax=Thalassobacillus sp. C254 TaxID=1225341 RepID=UPI0006CF8A26|nr:hypothetical protein [Thalassobacillus sp. C254]